MAVISYTGYDMEDAMILNKSAAERGFGYGSVYKTILHDISKEKDAHFAIGADVDATHKARESVGVDGLPYPGRLLKTGDNMVGVYHATDRRTKFERYKGDEDAWVDEVRIIGDDAGVESAKMVSIKLRIARDPTIGDKFSSRHGQKGVCSQRWPAVDMPFSESGIQPDVIINPHAFPSRMTIGMFVESLAGKAGALHGLCQDGTPFACVRRCAGIELTAQLLRGRHAGRLLRRAAPRRRLQLPRQRAHVQRRDRARICLRHLPCVACT